MRRGKDGPRVTGRSLPKHGGFGAVTFAGPRILTEALAFGSHPTVLFGHLQLAVNPAIPWQPAPSRPWRQPVAPAESGPSARERLHRLVSLSLCGWAFVVTAVVWELFAFTFSRRIGWQWDEGALFFAWGLGVLIFGFCLRTGRTRTMLSRVFLGVNILVVSLFSLLVGTS